MILQFKTDIVFLNFPDKTNLETMSYKISNDTMSIVKIDGQSPCNYTNKATYKILFKNEKIYISALSDDCPQRAAAWPSDGLLKID